MTGLPDFMLAPGPGRLDVASVARDVTEEQPAAASSEPPPRPEPPPFVPGIFRDMPAEQYFAIEAMSQSGAKEMLRSPAHYRYQRDYPSEPTDSMRFGTAVHAAVLEPDRFPSLVVRAPALNLRTVAGREARDAFAAANAGRVVLAPADFDRVQRCAEAVHRHPAARRLLAGGEVETCYFWVDRRFDVPCKARIDLRNHGAVIDLKTTTDACADEYARTIASYGYHLQAAFYAMACEELEHASPQFLAHIVVETEPPHGVACYAFAGNAILAGAARMNEAMRRYAQARASGRWDGYAPTVETIHLPRWATRVDHY